MKRPNVRVVTGALATRVLVEQGRAVGVEYRQGGETRVLRARAEVILAGGAINSPQLLMLSGIGPGAHLQGMGIPVAHDAPEVGANLADHLDITVQAALKTREAIGFAPSFLPRALRASWRASSTDQQSGFWT